MSGMLKYSDSNQLTVTAYRTSLNVSFIGDKKMEKPSNFGNLPILKKKNIIGGVQWRACSRLNGQRFI